MLEKCKLQLWAREHLQHAHYPQHIQKSTASLHFFQKQNHGESSFVVYELTAGIVPDWLEYIMMPWEVLKRIGSFQVQLL